MEPKDYWKVYEQLSSQVSELVGERTDLEVKLAETNKKIEHLQMTMRHLAPLTGVMAFATEFDDIKELGITDAVRSVLNQKTRMSATEVRTKMQERGYDFSKYSAPDATVRTILKRLVDAKKAEEEKEGHKVYYKWSVTDEEIPF